MHVYFNISSKSNNSAYHGRIFYLWPHFMIIKFNEYSIQMHWHRTQQKHEMNERSNNNRKLRIIIVFFSDMEFRAARSNKTIYCFCYSNWESSIQQCTHALTLIRAFHQLLDRFYLSHLISVSMAIANNCVSAFFPFFSHFLYYYYIPSLFVMRLGGRVCVCVCREKLGNSW